MTGPLQVGTRVQTDNGPGRIAAWHRWERLLFGRSHLLVLAVVELDTGGRRFFQTSQITPQQKEKR